MFALHVPLYNLFITLEQLVRGAPGQCLNQWSDCVAAAANVQLSLTGYALFLILTVTVCVLFQEQFVVRVRKRLVARFITPPAAAHAGKTAVKTSGS